MTYIPKIKNGRLDADAVRAKSPPQQVGVELARNVPRRVSAVRGPAPGD